MEWGCIVPILSRNITVAELRTLLISCPPTMEAAEYRSAVLTALSVYFSELPDTLVVSEVPVCPDLSDRDYIRIPDLLMAFDCDTELVEERRGYALELTERPPNFVLEVASPTTGVNDYTDKRLDYARRGQDHP